MFVIICGIRFGAYTLRSEILVNLLNEFGFSLCEVINRDGRLESVFVVEDSFGDVEPLFDLVDELFGLRELAVIDLNG